MKKLIFTATLVLACSSVWAGARDDIANKVIRKLDPQYKVPPPSLKFGKSGEEWASVSKSHTAIPVDPPPPKFDLHGGPGQLTPHFKNVDK